MLLFLSLYLSLSQYHIYICVCVCVCVCVCACVCVCVCVCIHRYNRKYLDWDRLIVLVGRVFANGPGDLGSIPGRVIPKTLIPLCLTLSNIRYVSRVKWWNPGKGVAPSATPRCSSYWKRSLLVALDDVRQLYLLLLIYIYTHTHIKALRRARTHTSRGLRVTVVGNGWGCRIHWLHLYRGVSHLKWMSLIWH